MRLVEEDKEEILPESDKEQLPKNILSQQSDKAILFAKKKTKSGRIRHLGEFKLEGSIYAGVGGEVGEEQKKVAPKTNFFSIEKDDKDAGSRRDNEQVFPLNTKPPQRTIYKIRIIRYCLLFLFLLALIPPDLYLSSLGINSRTGWIATRQTTETISISQITSSFTLALNGCHLKIIPLQVEDSNIEVFSSRSYEADYSYTENEKVEIKENHDWERICDIELRLPPNKELPTIILNLQGTEQYDLTTEGFTESSSLTLGSNRLEIGGKNAFIDLKGINAGSLIVDFTNAVLSISDSNLNSTSINIIQGFVNYELTPNFESMSASLNQAYGAICISAPVITPITNSSGCPNATRRASEIPMQGNVVDPSAECSLKSIICATGTNCSEGVNNQQETTITLKDGPIQIRMKDQIGYMAESFLPDQPTLNAYTIRRLSEYKTLMEENEELDYITKLDIRGPSYTELWIHSTKNTYLYARPWVLSLLSLSILLPPIDTQRSVIIDSKCPAAGGGQLLNGIIWDFIDSRLPQTSRALLTHKTAFNEYYTYEKTVAGNYEKEEVTILSDNGLILTCIILSVLLAIYGAVLVFLLLKKTVELASVLYEEFLENQRSLSQTKKMLGNMENEKSKVVKVGVNKLIILKLFSYDEYKLDLVEEKDNVNKLKESQISLFGLPQLYMDHMWRKAQDSAATFINCIPLSEFHFPPTVHSSFKEDATKTSVLLRNFQNSYEEFCTKFGFQPKNIAECESVLNKFQLEIEWRRDASTKVFTNIRFRRPNEQFNRADNIVEEGLGSVERFLKDECVYSEFSKDFLFVYEINVAYEAYCKEHNIPRAEVENIICSQFIFNFGAKIQEDYPIRYVNGITEGSSEKEGFNIQYSFKSGYVRKPIAFKSAVDMIKVFFLHLTSTAISGNGFFTQFFMVVVHLCQLLIICLPATVFVVWADLQISITSLDVYLISNIINYNSYDPWIDHIHIYPLFYAFIGLLCVFLFCGLFELISFYATCYYDNGKSKVRRSWPKAILQIILWILISIYASLYMAILVMTLVWFLLGAVLNPNKYLAYASAAATFIFFVKTKYEQINNLYETLQEKVAEIVEGEVNGMIDRTFQLVKDQDKTGTIAGLAGGGTLKDAGKALLSKTIARMLEKAGVPITADQLLALSSGNWSELEMVISKGLGIHPLIVKAISATARGQKPELIQITEEICKEVGMDPIIGTAIAELTLDSYNPDEGGIKLAGGATQLTIKQLFRKLFPSLPPEIIGGLIQMVAEGDPEPLLELAVQLGIPAGIFEIGVAMLKEDHARAEDTGFELAKQLLPEELIPFFQDLYYLQKGRSKDFTNIANFLHVRPKFILIFLLSIMRGDKDMARMCYDTIIEEVLRKLDIVKDPLSTEYDVRGASVRGHLLALYTISNGDSIDAKNITTKFKGSFNAHSIKALFGVVEGSAANLSIILDQLNAHGKKKIILEIYQMLQSSTNDCKEITKELGIKPQLSQSIYAFIKLGMCVSHLDCLMHEISELEFGVPESLNHIQDPQLKNFLKIFCEKMQEYIKVLVASGILKNKKGRKIKRIKEELKKGKTLEEQKRIETDIKVIYLNEIYYYDLLSKGNNTPLVIALNHPLLALSPGNKNVIKSLIGIVSTLKSQLLPIDLTENMDIQTHVLHAKSIAAFVGMDTYLFEFLLDLFSTNPIKIFKQNSKNLNQFSPDRITRISDILSTNSQNTKKLAKKWIKYDNLVQEGKASLRKLCTKFHIPYIFIELLDSTRVMDLAAGSHSGQYFRKIIYRFIAHLLRVIKEKRENYKYWEEYKEPEFAIQGIKEEFKLFDDYGDTKAVLISSLLSSFMRLLKGGEKELRLLKIGEKGVKVFNCILKYIIQPDFMRFIKIIWSIGKVIPFIDDDVNPDPNAQVYPEENVKSLQHKGIVEDIYLLDFMLLISAKSLADSCNREKGYGVRMQRTYNLIVQMNEELAKKPTTTQTCKTVSNINEFYFSYFQMGGFKLLAQKLFNKLFDKITFTKKFAKPELIFALFISIAIKNNHLTRSALLEIFASIKPEILTGFLAIQQGDLTNERCLRLIGKQLGVDNKLTIGLLQLLHGDTATLNRGIISICGEKVFEPELIGSIISLLKGHLSAARPLADKLGLDLQLLIGVIACAVRRIDVIKEFVLSLSQQLNIVNINAAADVLKIANGDYANIDDICRETNPEFRLEKVDLAEALVYLVSKGRQIFKEDMFTNDELYFDFDLSWANSVLAKYLSRSLDIASKKGKGRKTYKEAESKFFAKSSKDPLKKISSKKIVSAAQASEDKQFEIEYNLTILIGSIWRNAHSIARLSQLIKESNKHNDLWNNPDNLEKLDEIITIRFNSLYTKLNDIEIANKLKLEENKQEMIKMLKMFKKEQRIPKFEKEKEKLGYNLSSLGEKERQAFLIECTFNTTLYSTMNQTFYYCRTCSVELEDDIGCCEFCALFCHAGHKLEPGNSGKPTKTICDCGGGHYKTEKLNSENPLKKIITEEDFNWNKCCFRGLNAKKDTRSQFMSYFKEALVDKTKEREMQGKEGFILEGIGLPYPPSGWSREHSVTNISGNQVEEIIDEDIDKPGSEADISFIYLEEQEIGLEELLERYTDKDFLKDLTSALELPPLGKNIPIQNYIIMDDELDVNLHLFEQILMLAHGNPRMSLLPLLTAEGIVTRQDLFDSSIYSGGINVNMEFRSMAAMVSLAACDSFNFEQYGTGLHRSLKFDSRKEYSAEDKVRALLLLVSGGPMYIKLSKAEKEQTVLGSELGEESEQLSSAYDEIFDKLFHTVSRKAQILHFLVTMKKTDLFKILTENEENLSPELRIYQIIILKELFGKYLGFDRNTINWMKTLIRISLGDYHAIDFMGQELNIRSSSIGKLKALVCKKGHDFEPLLSAISHIIPHKIGYLLSEALQGEDSAFVDLICERFKYELPSEEIIEFMNHIEDQMEVGMLVEHKKMLEKRNRFREVIKALFEISKGDIYSMKLELPVLQKYLGLNEDVIKFACSLIGLLNDSKQHINDVFDIQTLGINAKLGNAILGLSSDKWEREDILIVLKHLLQHEEYYEKKTLLGPEVLEFIQDVAFALHGDITMLGYIADILLFKNESAICQMLVAFATGNYTFSDENVKEAEWENIQKKKFLLEIDRVFKIIFAELAPGKKKEMDEYFDRMHIPSLMYLLMSMDIPNVDKVFNVLDILAVDKDKDFIRQLIHFIKANDIVPNMDQIFKRATEFFTEKSLPQDTITINNFPSNINLPMNDTRAMNRRIKNLEEQVDWRRIVKLTMNKDSITISTSVLFKILMNTMNLNQESVKELIGIITPLLRNYAGVGDLIVVYGLLIRGNKEGIFNYLANILQMMVFMQYKANSERYEHQNIKGSMQIASAVSNTQVSPLMQKGLKTTLGTKMNALLDTQLFRDVVVWMRGCMLLLDKEEKKTDEEIDIIFREMMHALADAAQRSTIVSVKITNEEADMVADCAIGLMHLCKHDVSKIGPLALQIGSYEGNKMGKLFGMLKSLSKYMKDPSMEGIKELAAEALYMGAQENLSQLFTMFDADQSGYLDFYEFTDLCKYLGLFLTREERVKLFAKADMRNNNQIDYDEFANAMKVLNMRIAESAIDRMHLNKEDMMYALILSVVFLLLLLTFILIGVNAFSSSSAFGSMVNSMLPAGAGMGMGLKKDNLDKILRALSGLIQKIMKFLRND